MFRTEGEFVYTGRNMAVLNAWMFDVFLITICATLTYSLYEDQAGKYDWRQQYVGGAEHVILDQCGQGVCKSIIVRTDQHVIASLSMRTGEIVWRQIQEKSDMGRIDGFVLSENNLVAVMGGGSHLRCFNSISGTLNWEYNAEYVDPAQRATIGLLTADDKVVVIMLTTSTIYSVDMSGKLQWKQDLPNRDTVRYSYLRTDDEEGVISVIGVASKSHVVIVTMNSDGTLLPKHSAPAAWIQDDTSCQFSGDHFICLDVDNRILHQLSLKKPEIFRSSLFQDFRITCRSPTLMSDLGSGLQTEFGVRCVSSDQSQSVMLRATTDGIELVKDLPGVTALQILKYAEQEVFVTLARVKAEECQMKGYELNSGLEISELMQPVSIPEHHGVSLKLYGQMKKKENTPVFRILVLSEDDSMLLFSQTGKVSWVREEALAKVIAVDMIDLPVSPLLAKMEDEFSTNSSDIIGMLISRLKTQFVQVQDFFFQILDHFKSHRHSYYVGKHGKDYMDSVGKDEEEEEDYLYRDEFNIKKIIIMATEVSKVCGLYSPTGRILWCHLLPDMVPFQAAGKSLYTIFMQRTTSHFPHEPYCTMLGKHKHSGRGMIYRFHPVTGQPLYDTPPGGELLNYKIKQVMLLSHMDEHFLRPLVVLDTELKFHVYPESATEMVKSMARSLFMMTSDTASSQLYGYSMVYKDDKGLCAENVWSLNLAVESQKITNIVFKQPLERVHSQGIVLADRSVSYKYLNPNLVVITAEGTDSSQKGFLNVYLVDSVSGQLVFHCNHKRVKGPVHVVHSENWIVYDYWNQRHRRTEIAVLELYEGKKQNNATAFSSLYPPPLPLVLRQAYIISAHISTMAVTITEKGITNKHLLLALESGGILEMQKALLDPRRPDVPTQEHREEGIIPYAPELPRHNEAVINYNRSVYNVRAIHTAPAGLESHSIILCYGLDIFYTRVMPSKMFDVLKEDFDYFFIGSVTLGMIIVSLISKKLAARKALNRAWK